MEVKVSRDMIAKAIKAVDEKLIDDGEQKKKVYNENYNENSYYINNLLGELAELAFEAALESNDYLNGVDPKKFGVFKNSDICDFYGSKSGKTIDVKTSHKEANRDLLVNKRTADWRPIDEYVLVKLHPSSDEQHTLSSLINITSATIEGGARYSKMSRTVNFGGGESYITNFDELEPIGSILERNFFKSNEKIERYIPSESIELHIASIQNGPASEIEYTTKNRISMLSRYYLGMPEEDSCHNFKSPFRNASMPGEERIAVSFAIYDMDNKFSTSLFIKTLLTAEYTARLNKRLLVIPSYIEHYIPIENLKYVENAIKQLKCEVDCSWSYNNYY